MFTKKASESLMFKTNGNQWFCTTSVWILCVVVLDPSYLCLLLSLRGGEFSPGPLCPEVPLNYFASTLSVSRCRFRIFTLMRPAVGPQNVPDGPSDVQNVKIKLLRSGFPGHLNVGLRNRPLDT